MKTRNQAINHARRNIGELYSFAGQWRFHRHDATTGAWRESISAPWHVAVANRSQALIDSAREFLELEPVQYDGGAWVDYV